ncbi:MFS transporter [Streptomyces sp. 21So2-11]|uniref:MFS transporter n=1 Tax=Streptomyces sp. 21So2-11 TaxID=3144408 RepID=UPI00321A60FA
MYLASSRSTDVPDGPATGRSPGSGPARKGMAGTVVALGAVSLVSDISSEMVTAVMPLYFVLGLGMSPLQFGFLDGIYNGISAFVRLAGGHIADRRQRYKAVAGAGYALSALCKLGLLFAGTSTPALSTALAADRVGKGIRTGPRDALITLSCDPRDLGRAFGVHRAMDTTGALLGPLAAFALLWVTMDAYESVFVVSFCFGVLGVLILLAFVPGHRHTADRKAAAPRLRDTVGLVREPGFRRMLITASALGLVTVGDGFIFLLLQSRLDFTAGYLPLLPLGTALVYLTLAVPFGRIADRHGRRGLYLLGHTALLAVYAVLLTPLGGPALLIAALVLHGTFYAATDGVLMALAGPSLPGTQRAGGLAILQTGQAVGRLLASVLFGAAWTTWGTQPALALAAAGLALTLPICLFLLPTQQEPTP